jgi:hypothetical protein
MTICYILPYYEKDFDRKVRNRKAKEGKNLEKRIMWKNKE